MTVQDLLDTLDFHLRSGVMVLSSQVLVETPLSIEKLTGAYVNSDTGTLVLVPEA